MYRFKTLCLAVGLLGSGQVMAMVGAGGAGIVANNRKQATVCKATDLSDYVKKDDISTILNSASRRDSDKSIYSFEFKRIYWLLQHYICYQSSNPPECLDKMVKDMINNS